MTEPKVGNTRVPLETGDPATPGLGWAPGDSVDASAAEEGLGWAGLGTLCRQNRTLFDLLIEQNKQKLQITSFVNTHTVQHREWEDRKPSYILHVIAILH